MRYILLVVTLLTMLFLSACGYEVITGADAKGKVVSVSYAQRFFKDEAALLKAIIAERDTEYKGYDLGDVTHYFVPDAIPKGMKLKQVTARDTHISFYYGPKEVDPHWEKTFILEWFRTEDSSAKELADQDNCTTYEGEYTYTIVAVEPWDGYRGKKDVIRREVYWDQGEDTFYAVVPASFTTTDIETYCVAKQVDID